MSLVSEGQLAAFAPRCDAGAIAPHLDREAARAGIDTPLRLAHWLGQLHHESAGFKQLVENLTYSAERLMQVWPARFTSLDQARTYAGNPEALAEKVYAGRLGNRFLGDGWRYRGRGFIQITGRANYRRFGALTGLDLEGDPDLAAGPRAAARVAGAYWRDLGLNALADQDDLEAVTRAINGGLTGLADRRRLLARAKTLWR